MHTQDSSIEFCMIIVHILSLNLSISKTPLLIATGGSIPLFCLEGGPAFPGASQDEAGLTRMLEKTLESPLDCKEILPVHSKGDQSWVFIVRTDAEAEEEEAGLP